MDSVGIVGVGLIGGSIGLALKKSGFKGRIIGISSPRTIEAALARGAIDAGETLEAAALSVDLLYLAQPIQVILQTLEELGRTKLRPECLVTDAGSTKAVICARAKSVLKDAQFLGGHPMAGKETRGVEVADADLFRGRTYVLTPYSSAEMHTPSVSAFAPWLEKFGSKIVVISPENHDRTVAFTSHLPQLASTALGGTLADCLERAEQFSVAGPGLQDMTRLALSPFDIWRDILSTNSTAVSHALDVYIDKLTEMRDNLQTQQLRESFSKAAATATRIRRQA